MKTRWIQFGDNVMFSVDDLVFVARDGDTLAIVLRGGVPQTVTAISEDAAIRHYLYIQGLLGFEVATT